MSQIFPQPSQTTAPAGGNRAERLTALFRSDLFLRAEQEPGDHAAAPADALHHFLLRAADALGAQRVFEFGSGRSTSAFLQHGLHVTSLEDDARWMDDTLRQLDEAQIPDRRHAARVQPLKLKWRGGIPFRDWRLDGELADAVAVADLVLIDSPFHVPFRISTLCAVLSLPTDALVVLDDTRIHTLRRACARIARRNARRLHHAHVNVGHGFDCFARRDLDITRPLTLRFGPLEILKGWRRYFLQPKPLGG